MDLGPRSPLFPRKRKPDPLGVRFRHRIRGRPRASDSTSDSDEFRRRHAPLTLWSSSRNATSVAFRRSLRAGSLQSASTSLPSAPLCQPLGPFGLRWLGATRSRFVREVNSVLHGSEWTLIFGESEVFCADLNLIREGKGGFRRISFAQNFFSRVRMHSKRFPVDFIGRKRASKFLFEWEKAVLAFLSECVLRPSREMFRSHFVEPESVEMQ